MSLARMTPEQFFRRWAAKLDERFREQFLVELGALISHEQARERRRLCTDPALYQQACEQTADEILRYRAAGEDEGQKTA